MAVLFVPGGQAIVGANMVKASAVAKVLGGEKTLGIRVSSQQDLITAVRRGLRTSAVEAIIEELDAPAAAVLPALRIARRTMERRKAKGRLLPQESERVYRLAKVLAFAESVLGNKEKARHWLNTPNRAVGNVTPLSLTETEAGADEVTNLLGRINDGIYS
ncbi:MAG TPA: antitoxin Xre/MbcA/ParS toxin-binding domain-containing protein [Pyrinomonadaceae bacterium]|jgi:putative toxin-antitoxin system antitoxin component (TIGR02293 family)